MLIRSGIYMVFLSAIDRHLESLTHSDRGNFTGWVMFAFVLWVLLLCPNALATFYLSYLSLSAAITIYFDNSQASTHGHNFAAVFEFLVGGNRPTFEAGRNTEVICFAR